MVARGDDETHGSKIWRYFWRWFRAVRNSYGSKDALEDRDEKEKENGKENSGGGEERQRQRATYTRRWITHDCLAWNYSISPSPLSHPTNHPPRLVRLFAALSFNYASSLTRVSSLPSSYYYFSARDLAPTTSFLAEPVVDDDDEEDDDEETRRAGNSMFLLSLPFAKSGLGFERARLFLRKIRLRWGEGERDRWPSLCARSGASWNGMDFSDDQKICFRSQEFREFLSYWEGRRLFMGEIISLYVHYDFVNTIYEYAINC